MTNFESMHEHTDPQFAASTNDTMLKSAKRAPANPDHKKRGNKRKSRRDRVKAELPLQTEKFEITKYFSVIAKGFYLPF